MTMRPHAILGFAVGLIMSLVLPCGAQQLKGKYAKYDQEQRMKLLGQLVGKTKTEIVEIFGPPDAATDYSYVYTGAEFHFLSTGCDTVWWAGPRQKPKYTGWRPSTFGGQAGEFWRGIAGATEPEQVAIGEYTLAAYDPRLHREQYRQPAELMFLSGKTITGLPFYLYVSGPTAIIYTPTHFSVSSNKWESETKFNPLFNWKTCKVGGFLLGQGDPINMNFGAYTSFYLPKPKPAGPLVVTRPSGATGNEAIAYDVMEAWIKAVAAHDWKRAVEMTSLTNKEQYLTSYCKTTDFAAPQLVKSLAQPPGANRYYVRVIDKYSHYNRLIEVDTKARKVADWIE